MKRFLKVLSGTFVFPFVMVSAVYATPSSSHDPLAFGPDTVPPARLVTARHGMVVSAQHLASDVGAEILKQGGNAIDAAVATGYALAVVYPAAGNLGGGGFMTLRVPGEGVHFIDFREKAPLKAHRDMFMDKDGHAMPQLAKEGWLSVAVPGTVAGLEMVREKWGRLTREQDIAPAIRLAEQGFVLEQGDVDLLNTSTSFFKKDPVASSFYLRADGSSLQVGDVLVQKNLAKTLREISKSGTKSFYKGKIASQLVHASKKGGGILTKKDFKLYQPRLLEPQFCKYRGLSIYTAPPPSAGGAALCEMLSILEGYNLQKLGFRTKTATRLEIEAMRHAYSDRQLLGDLGYAENPVKLYTDPHYARAIRESLPKRGAVDSRRLVPKQAALISSKNLKGHWEAPKEKHETTHYSVIDDKGMAVSVTYTLNGWFGAGIQGGDTGIWMNDEMDDFSMHPGVPNMFGIPGSEANAIAAEKRPLSSMSPTIIMDKDQVRMVTGAPGGSRIPTIVLNVILNAVDYKMDVARAVDTPRIHEQWMPSEVEYEPKGLSQSVIKSLRAQGYHFLEHRPWGMAESIMTSRTFRTQSDGKFYGAADPRHPGGKASGF